MKILELERLEARLAAIAESNETVLVRFKLFGTIEQAWTGKLLFQLNSEDDPQFVVTKAGNPNYLIFRVRDVLSISESEAPSHEKCRIHNIFLQSPGTPEAVE